MKKDFKKLYNEIYLPPKFKPMIVTAPSFNYLMVSGEGHPEEPSFQMAAQTLFPVAYVSKFILKAKSPKDDFTIMPMEVKWKLDRSHHGTKRYSWTMMIMQPKCISKIIISKAIRTLKQKKKSLPYEERLRLQPFNIGKCGQIFHIGPYGGPMDNTFEILKSYLIEQGYEWEPDSHDVYYNDIRRTPPEKLKTLMRIRIWTQGKERKLEDPFLTW